MRQVVVDGIDWGIIGVAAILFFVSLAGACLSLAYSSSGRRPAAREFNYLWRVRAFTGILSAAYALSHLLRLQLLWGPASVFKEGGFYPTIFCRVYIAATYGIFEPGFLLLAVFACLYSVQGRDSARNPNSNIVLFTVGFSLPACASQIVAALFTRIVELDYTHSRILRLLFDTYSSDHHQHCHEDSTSTSAPSPPPSSSSSGGNCAFCVFPLLSTFASTVVCAICLLALWVVTQRIAAVVVNRVITRRLRTMQLLTTVWVVVGLACRGCTVLFQPFDLGFEALRVAHMVSVTALVLTLQYFLVLKPVWDTRQADLALQKLEGGGSGGDGGLGGGAGHSDGGLPAPLLPADQENGSSFQFPYGLHGHPWQGRREGEGGGSPERELQPLDSSTSTSRQQLVHQQDEHRV